MKKEISEDVCVCVYAWCACICVWGILVSTLSHLKTHYLLKSGFLRENIISVQLEATDKKSILLCIGATSGIVLQLLYSLSASDFGREKRAISIFNICITRFPISIKSHIRRTKILYSSEVKLYMRMTNFYCSITYIIFERDE